MTVTGGDLILFWVCFLIPIIGLLYAHFECRTNTTLIESKSTQLVLVLVEVCFALMFLILLVMTYKYYNPDWESYYQTDGNFFLEWITERIRSI